MQWFWQIFIYQFILFCVWAISTCINSFVHLVAMLITSPPNLSLCNSSFAYVKPLGSLNIPKYFFNFVLKVLVSHIHFAKFWKWQAFKFNYSDMNSSLVFFSVVLSSFLFSCPTKRILFKLNLWGHPISVES